MKHNTMKKVNGALSAVFVLTVVALAAALFLPFFSFDPPADYVAPDPNATVAENTDADEDAFEDFVVEDPIVVNADGKVVYSIQDYIWTKCSLVNKELAKVIDGYKTGSKSYAINQYVTVFVITLALGLTTVISHICSRRAIFTQISSVAYCVSALICAFGAAIWPYGNPMVQTLTIIAALASTVVCLARIYPWYAMRFVYKPALNQ